MGHHGAMRPPLARRNGIPGASIAQGAAAAKTDPLGARTPGTAMVVVRFLSIVVGTFNPNGLSDFAANTARLAEGSPLRTVADRSLAFGDVRLIPPGGRVFTDDHAPVEWVVDQIILDVAREGDDE